MRKLLTILAVLISLISSAQKYQDATLFGSKDNGRSVGRFFAFPTGCGAPGTPIVQDIAEKRGALYNDTCGHYIFVWDPSLNAWDTLLSTTGVTGSTAWGTITGSISAQTDLMAQLNLRLLLSDTSGMLANYVRSINNLSPLFNASISSHAISFSFQSAPTKTFFGRGAGGSGNPSYISWDSLPGANLTFSSGLLRTGNNVVALNLEAIWNTNEFQDYPIQSGQPNNNDIFVFNLESHEWELRNLTDIVTGGGGGGGGSGVSSFLYIDTLLQRLATVINDSTAILKSLTVNGSFIETDSTLQYLVGWDNVMAVNPNLTNSYNTDISIGNSWNINGNNAGTGLMIIGNNGANGSGLQVVGDAIGLTSVGGTYGAWVINNNEATNTVEHGLLMSRSPDGNGAAGLGLDIRFDLPDDDNNMRDAAEIVTDWVSASSINHVAEMHFDLIDDDSTDRKRVLTLRGDNQGIQFNGYGQGNLSDPPTYLLGVDAAGNVLEVDTTGLSVGGGGGNTIYSADDAVADANRIVDLAPNDSRLRFNMADDNTTWFQLYGDANKLLQFVSSDPSGAANTSIQWGYDASGIYQNTYFNTTDGGANGGQQYRVNNNSDVAIGNFTELIMYNDTTIWNGEYFWLTVNGEGGVGVRGDRYDDGISQLLLHGTNIVTNGSVQFGTGGRYEYGTFYLTDTDYTVGDFDYAMFESGATVDRTITLPNCTGNNTYREFRIFNINSAGGNTIITGVSGQTINGGATFTLNGLQSVDLMSNGSSGWSVTSFWPD